MGPFLQSYRGRALPERDPADVAIEEEIKRKYGQRLEDPYSQEVGPGAGIMRGIDSWLTENVVEPSAKAGYPEIGAGVAAAGSTIADLAVPQTAGDFAGVLIPFGKAGKAAKGLSKEARVAKEVAEENPIKAIDGRLGGDTDPFRWTDVKSGYAKRALSENKGKPLTISTSSDLIAHDDYISQLDPKLHTVEFRLSPDVPLNEFMHMEKYKGSPSFARQAKAIKKLRDAGINVRVIDAPEKALDDLSAQRSLGFVPKRGE